MFSWPLTFGLKRVSRSCRVIARRLAVRMISRPVWSFPLPGSCMQPVSFSSLIRLHTAQSLESQFSPFLFLEPRDLSLRAQSQSQKPHRDVKLLTSRPPPFLLSFFLSPSLHVQAIVRDFNPPAFLFVSPCLVVPCVPPAPLLSLSPPSPCSLVLLSPTPSRAGHDVPEIPPPPFTEPSLLTHPSLYSSP